MASLLWVIFVAERASVCMALVNGQPSDRVVDRIRCAEMHRQGVGAVDIAQDLGRSASFVNSWRAQPFNRMGDAPRTGRPRIITPPIRRWMLRIMHRFSITTSAGSLSRGIRARFGITISANTVRREMLRLGFRALRRPVVPPLSAVNIRDRAAFASIQHGYGGWSADRFERELLTLDESLFALTEGQAHGRRFVWVQRRDQVTGIVRPGQQVRYMMLLVMTATGIEYLWLPHGVRLNAQGFIHAMQIIFRRIAQRQNVPLAGHSVLAGHMLQNPNQFTLQQDGAPVHTAHVTQRFLQQQHGLNLITSDEWPGNSPDLNPPENIFSYIKRRVYTGRPFTSGAQMKAKVRRVIRALPRALLRNLIRSMQRRLRLVRQNPARTIPY